LISANEGRGGKPNSHQI
jgi:hypothetical protein